MTPLQFRYRGNVAKDGKIGSARDFGNMAAGIGAARNGLGWGEATLGFDALETAQNPSLAIGSRYSLSPGLQIRIRPTKAGPPTRKAERLGFTIGQQLRKQDQHRRSYNRYFRTFKN